MRLIDADAIIKEIKARNPDDVSYEDAWAITCIEHAPTIEPERRKGVWLDDDGDILTGGYCATCSVCGEWSEYLTAYCGNCGAKMERTDEADALEPDADYDDGDYWAVSITPIHNAPTVKQHKTGKWVHGREILRETIGDCITAIFYDGWTCSECGYLIEKEREPWYKYCPNCGAKMEGSE